MQITRTSSIILCAVSVLLTACRETKPLEIRWSPFYLGEPVSCSLTTDSGIKIDEMRLYVHGIELQDAEGNWREFQITPADSSQSGEVALLDFDAAAKPSCTTPSKPFSVVLKGRLPEGRYQKVRFTLGVPFSLNHQDPARAKYPLNDTSMHWHWQGGYKFLRIKLTKAGQEKYIHLGSLGCQGRIGEVTGCNTPNRALISLDGFSTEKNIAIDVSHLISEANLTNSETPMSCMGQGYSSWCDHALKTLGLDGQGVSSFSEQQSVFLISENSKRQK